MLSVREIIKRVRVLVHDETGTGYSDESIINAINSAIRFIRRTVKQYKSSMLVAEPLVGVVSTVNNKIVSSDTITKILDVRIDGKKITSIDMAFIDDISLIGTPEYYYQVGSNTICLYPTPSADTQYNVIYVGDCKEISHDDNSPFPNDFDDFVIEYVVIRISCGNEFNMSQETQLMYEINEQIKANLCGSEYSENCVRGYYGDKSFLIGGY